MLQSLSIRSRVELDMTEQKESEEVYSEMVDEEKGLIGQIKYFITPISRMTFLET
jgi:hypothetical protein